MKFVINQASVRVYSDLAISSDMPVYEYISNNTFHSNTPKEVIIYNVTESLCEFIFQYQDRLEWYIFLIRNLKSLCLNYSF